MATSSAVAAPGTASGAVQAKMSRPSIFFLTAFLLVVAQPVLYWNHILRSVLVGEENSDGSKQHHYHAGFEIVTTDFGWTSDNPRGNSRRILTGEFFNATINHPRYNASAWRDLHTHPDKSRQLIAFLDVDTCIELNYPHYGGREWWRNQDISLPDEKFNYIIDSSCEHINRALRSPALTANPSSKLILTDCSGSRRFWLHIKCPSLVDEKQLLIGFMSIDEANIRKGDVGLPPPAIKPATLNATDRHQVELCSKRKYLFSFQGRSGNKGALKRRNDLLQLNSFDDVLVEIRDQSTYLEPSQGTLLQNVGIMKRRSTHLVRNITKRRDNDEPGGYGDILRRSTFVGAPRGDNLFSYRFSEILSAGAIPVVYADGWVPPFSDVVNWTECAVFISEDNYSRTRDILIKIPEEERCKMQRCALNFWDRYANDRRGWLDGLIEVALSQTSEV